MRSSIIYRKWYVFLAAPVIWLLDYVTKMWAVSALALPHRSIEIISGYFDLSYAENTGVAFGIMNSLQAAWKPYLLSGLAVAALIVIVVYYHKTPPERRLLRVALAVVSGGILGNLTDRIFRTAVVDFIEVHFRDIYYWPNFNVADSAITVGVILLILDSIMNPRASENEK